MMSRMIWISLGVSWLFLLLSLPAVTATNQNNNVRRSFEITSRKFPDIMTELAFHPDSPNILATISGSTSTVYLFTKDALLEQAGTEEKDKWITASASERVGNMPTSLVFKTTSTGKTYLIIGCGHDDHLYVFLVEDDGSMQLSQSLAISGGSVSHMTASHNTKDPFVYYNFVPDDGPGYHPRSLGAISFDSDTSTWNNLGVVPLVTKLGNNEYPLVAQRSFVSHDGIFLYNNGEFGDRMLSSFILTSNSTTTNNDPTDDAFWNSLDQPSFEMSYCQNRDNSGKIRIESGAFPDPSGKWVAIADYFLPAGFVDMDPPDPTTLPLTSGKCPYESIEVEGLVVTEELEVAVTAYNSPSNTNNSPLLGFGFRQDGWCCQIPSEKQRVELKQVLAVHISSDEKTLGTYTSNNITIPVDMLRLDDIRPHSDRSPADSPVFDGGNERRLEEAENYGLEDGEWGEQEEENEWGEQEEEDEWGEEDFIDDNFDDGNELFDVQVQLQLFSNFMGEDLWLAMGDKLAYTSYSCFLGSEDGDSGLDLQLDKTQFDIHKANAAKFTFDSSSYALSFDELPENASYDTDTQELRWTPKAEQVGDHDIFGRITSQSNGSGTSSCAIMITLSASVPSIDVPYSVDRFSVSEVGNALVAWTTTTDSSYSGNGNSQPSNMTLVELNGDKGSSEQSTKSLAYTVSQAFVGEKQIVVLEKGCEQIHLLDRSTLEELKSMQNPSVINRYNCDSFQYFDVTDGVLQFCNNPGYCDTGAVASFDINADSGELVEIDVVKPYNQVFGHQGQTYVEGFLKQGVLYDHLDRSKELLVLDPGPFFVGSISSKDVLNQNQNPVYFPDEPVAVSSSPYSFLHPVQNPSGNQMMEMPGSGVFIVYELGRNAYQNDGSTVQNSTLTVIDHNGHVLEKETLFSYRFGPNERRQYSYNNNAPVITKDGELFVAFAKKLYRWKWEGHVESPSEPKGFHFVDKQSKFRISSNAAKEELPFELKGGVGPFDLYLQYPATYDSELLKSLITVDEASSSIHINGKDFHKEAIQVMVNFGVRNGIPEVHSASLKDVQPWSLLNGQDSIDLPVALPIFLHAIDSRGEKASLEYFVYTSVSYDDLPSLIEKAYQDTLKNATATGDSAFDKRDVEIILLIALVVLLTIILGCLSCLVVWKVFLSKDKAEILNEAEVDGLIKTNEDETASESNTTDDPLSSNGSKPTPEVV